MSPEGSLARQAVRFTLNVPYSVFPSQFAGYQAGIVPRDKIDELTTHPIDISKIEPLFHELELNRLLEEIRKQSGDAGDAPPEPEEESDYRAVTTEVELKKVATAIQKAGLAAVDTETSGLDPRTAELVGVCLSWKSGSGVYVPVGHTGEGADKNLDLKIVQKHLKPLFADPKIRWIAHHSKYDGFILENAGFGSVPFAFDTLLAAYLMDPAARHSLDALAFELCGHHMIPIDSLIGTGKKQISFAEVPVDKATPYAAEDADYTLRLFENLEPRVKDAKLDKLLYEVEQPLVPVLMAMERSGIKLDTKLLAKQSRAMEKGLEEITHDIETLAGHPFNINSTKQLQEVLFEELKLPTRGNSSLWIR